MRYRARHPRAPTAWSTPISSGRVMSSGSDSISMSSSANHAASSRWCSRPIRAARSASERVSTSSNSRERQTHPGRRRCAPRGRTRPPHFAGLWALRWRRPAANRSQIPAKVRRWPRMRAPARGAARQEKRRAWPPAKGRTSRSTASSTRGNARAASAHRGRANRDLGAVT